MASEGKCLLCLLTQQQARAEESRKNYPEMPSHRLEPLHILFPLLLLPECSYPGILVDILCAAADPSSLTETQLCLHQPSVVQKNLENPFCIRFFKKPEEGQEAGITLKDI